MSAIGKFWKQIISEVKYKYDKQEKQLIKEYKHPTKEKMIPVIKYFWTQMDWEGYPALKINIQCPDMNSYEKISGVQEALWNLGIEFSLSYGGSVGWKFDHGLCGYHFFRETQMDDFKYIIRAEELGSMLGRPAVELVHQPYSREHPYTGEKCSGEENDE